jgi:hypothetical protein
MPAGARSVSPATSVFPLPPPLFPSRRSPCPCGVPGGLPPWLGLVPPGGFVVDRLAPGRVGVPGPCRDGGQSGLPLNSRPGRGRGCAGSRPCGRAGLAGTRQTSGRVQGVPPASRRAEGRAEARPGGAAGVPVPGKFRHRHASSSRAPFLPTPLAGQDCLKESSSNATGRGTGPIYFVPGVPASAFGGRTSPIPRTNRARITPPTWAGRSGRSARSPPVTPPRGSTTPAAGAQRSGRQAHQPFPALRQRRPIEVAQDDEGQHQEDPGVGVPGPPQVLAQRVPSPARWLSPGHSIPAARPRRSSAADCNRPGPGDAPSFGVLRHCDPPGGIGKCGAAGCDGAKYPRHGRSFEGGQ